MINAIYDIESPIQNAIVTLLKNNVTNTGSAVDVRSTDDAFTPMFEVKLSNTQPAEHMAIVNGIGVYDSYKSDCFITIKTNRESNSNAIYHNNLVAKARYIMDDKATLNNQTGSLVYHEVIDIEPSGQQNNTDDGDSGTIDSTILTYGLTIGIKPGAWFL